MTPATAEVPPHYEDIEFRKIRVGLQDLQDAVLNLGTITKNNRQYGDKNFILRALAQKDYATQRLVSQYFYEISGIYERLVKYFAFLYRYDYYLTPYIIENEGLKENKVLTEFAALLTYLDNSNLKKVFGDIALKVIRDGCYYGYWVDTKDCMSIQELPPDYCRCRYFKAGLPAVEFNMKFFDDKFPDPVYRMKVLKLFPEDFQQGYVLYKRHKLIGDGIGDGEGWYLLDVDAAFKFNLNNSDMPILVNCIPALIDLDGAQDLDRRKTMQQLLKILIQKLPLDKNGDLIFDVDEAKDIHNNAVSMLKRAVGVDVLTTFADTSVEDMADTNSTAAAADGLAKIERQVYNEFGVSQNLFNSDGNIALQSSILNDEASMRNLLLQYEAFLNKLIQKKAPGNKRYSFRCYILETTIYNYQDVAKFYKELVQIGYSKMLPLVAMGQRQSSILATSHFENEVLHLSEIMIPPMMSSTMSGKNMGSGNKTAGGSGQAKTEKSDGNTGRPEKPDSEKSDKTIANRNSQG